MKRSLLAALAAALLAGCATVVARKPVAEAPRLGFLEAKKELLAAARSGILEKRAFVMATMKGGGIAQVEEDRLILNYDAYHGLLSDQTRSVNLGCPYDSIGGDAINQYKTGGAGRARSLTYEIPLGPHCGDLAYFFPNEQPALRFARALKALRRRAAEGPTDEERAAAVRASGGISKEDIAGIVQAAVAGATRAQTAPARAPVSDVDAPRYRHPERKDDFAIVVGIEKYMDLPDAQYAEHDAEAMKNHLIAAGYPSRNVVELSGEKAGRSSLEKFLESWLPRNATRESRVFFYFSGHGAPDPKTGEAYLIPWDGDPNFLENTGYPLKRLYARLSALDAKEVVVALDACFSGAGGRSVLAKGARPLVTTVSSAAPPAEMTVFAAAAGDQITSTLGDQGHGIFTYYFLKGFAGEAKTGDGGVTARSLFGYLKPKVQDAARRQNRDQAPVLTGPPERELTRF